MLRATGHLPGQNYSAIPLLEIVYILAWTYEEFYRKKLSF